MIKNKKIANLFNAYKHTDNITTFDLTCLGFSQYEIKKLISEGIIKRTYKGHYLIVREKDVVNKEEYYEILYKSLCEKDYQKVWDCFRIIFSMTNSLNPEDNKFYIYMLSLIVFVPEDIRKMLSLKVEEMLIKLGDEKYTNINVQNDIRLDIFKGDYLEALKKLSDLTEKNGNISLWNRITIRLLGLIIEKELITGEKIKSKLTSGININDVIAKIRNYLINGDTLNAFKTLREYLEQNEKRKYEPLLVGLIKLNILNNDDPLFNILSSTLNDIINNSCDYNFMMYLNDFYNALINKEFVKASIYLDIIKGAKNIKPDIQECTFIEELSMLLEKEQRKEKNSESSLKQKKKRKKASKKESKEIITKEFDGNKYFGITNFYEIDEYIRKSNLDVESACFELGLDEETTYLIILIYAREYYIQGFPKKGDEFFKTVERYSNKSIRIKKALDEIRQSKRLFNNRNGEYDLELTLTLKPKSQKEC